MPKQNRLVKPAKAFLKEYFSDGVERKPLDFCNEILGGVDGGSQYSFPTWNCTPFYDALGELIYDGTILFKISDSGEYIYWMPKTNKS